MSYYREVYLKSQEWDQIKAEKESRTPKRCAICAAESRIDLHHLFYRANLSETKTSDLRWLCRRCHDLAHELIKSKLLIFRPGMSHQGMFSLTKRKVLMALDSNCQKIDETHPMAQRINALKTGPAGWTRAALATLGVPWPPPKGWRKALIRQAMEKSHAQ